MHFGFIATQISAPALQTTSPGQQPDPHTGACHPRTFRLPPLCLLSLPAANASLKPCKTAPTTPNTVLALPHLGSCWFLSQDFSFVAHVPLKLSCFSVPLSTDAQNRMCLCFLLCSPRTSVQNIGFITVLWLAVFCLYHPLEMNSLRERNSQPVSVPSKPRAICLTLNGGLLY